MLEFYVSMFWDLMTKHLSILRVRVPFSLVTVHVGAAPLSVTAPVSALNTGVRVSQGGAS